MRLAATCVIGLSALFVIVGASVGGSVQDAHACTVGPPQFELLMEDASIIALVDVTDVGGPDNPHPTMTPRATYTPTASATQDPDVPTSEPSQPLDSPTPRPTEPGFDLAGIGATANIIRVYRGEAESPSQLGAIERAELERDLRLEETRRPEDGFPPCPIWLGTYRYTPGARYVLFADRSGESLESAGFYAQWEVFGADTDEPYIDPRGMNVTEPTYRTYLTGVDALPVGDDSLSRTWYQIQAERLPLATFESMILVEPPQRIIAPETGSGGLKAASP